MKCLLDRRDRAALPVAEAFGSTATPRASGEMEVQLRDTWAADLVSLMRVLGEGVRRGAVMTAEEEGGWRDEDRG